MISIGVTLVSKNLPFCTLPFDLPFPASRIPDSEFRIRKPVVPCPESHVPSPVSRLHSLTGWGRCVTFNRWAFPSPVLVKEVNCFSTSVFFQGFTQDFYQGEVWQLLTNTVPWPDLSCSCCWCFPFSSWAIIIRKNSGSFGREIESLEFLKVFRQSKKLSEIRAFCRTLKESPLPEVFQSGYREVESQAALTEGAAKPRIKSLEAVRRALQIGSSTELGRLETVAGVGSPRLEA